MKALLKKVVVELIKDDEILKSTEVKATVRGKVFSKGPLCECDIAEGDTILFSGFAGARFEEQGSTYFVLNQEEILVKL
jgi:co-chaperonin GroES (HSP10)